MIKISMFAIRIVCGLAVFALYFAGPPAYGQTPGFVPYNPNVVYPTNSYGYRTATASSPPQVFQQPVTDPFAIQRQPAFGNAGRPVYNVAQVPQQFAPPAQFTPPQQFTQPQQFAQPQQFVQPQQFTQPQQFPQQVVPQQFPQVQPGQPVYVPQNYTAPGVQSSYPVLDSCNQFLNCTPQTTWTTQLNWLYMTRTKSSNFPLLMDLPGGGTLVDAADLDYGWKSGFDVALARRLQNGSNLELRYFQISAWTAILSNPYVEGDAIATNPPTLLLDPGLDPGVVDYNARSSLHSFEINLVDRSVNNERLQFAVGFRWMEVNENLAQSFTRVDPVMFADIELFNINTNNHLYGLQFGANGVFYDGPRFNMVGWGKAGVFANVADQSTTATIGGVGGPFIVANSSRNTTTSFVGETGILADWQLFPRASLVGGYQLLWVSGAALAPDQLPNMSSVLGGLVPTGVDQSTAYYHGLFAGVDVHW